MKYRLKKTEEAIQIVDGPYAGRKYAKGTLYNEIPPEEAHRFEKAKETPAGDKQGTAEGKVIDFKGKKSVIPEKEDRK